MRRVAIASYATSKFKKDSGLSLFELACRPCIDILKDKDLKNQIDSVLVSTCSEEQYASSIIAEMLGLRPKISHRIDNLCNSGTNAIASAYAYISSGLCDSSLVVGMEKTPSPGNKLRWDTTRGLFSFPVHWAAMFAKAHMRKYGSNLEQMAFISAKNRANAQKNPNAFFYGMQVPTIDDIKNSRLIADPVRLLDCSLPCDGSSAVLLVAEDKIKQFTDNPVWIKGIGQQTTCASFGNMAGELCSIESAQVAAKQAFAMANVKPSQIEVAELHDSFSILEILAYEDIGFTEKGNGGKYAYQDQISINPRGGILGCGHPVGATGVAQVAEIAAQLSQEANQRQVSNCKTGLVHNLAAAGTSATIMIMGT